MNKIIKLAKRKVNNLSKALILLFRCRGRSQAHRNKKLSLRLSQVILPPVNKQINQEF